MGQQQDFLAQLMDLLLVQINTSAVVILSSKACQLISIVLPSLIQFSELLDEPLSAFFSGIL